MMPFRQLETLAADVASLTRELQTVNVLLIVNDNRRTSLGLALMINILTAKNTLHITLTATISLRFIYLSADCLGRFCRHHLLQSRYIVCWCVTCDPLPHFI